MKKIIVLLVVLFTSVTMYAQWGYKNVDNPFDGTFKKAYCFSTNGELIMMEEGETFMSAHGYFYPLIFLTSSYFCDGDKLVELVFVVNGEKKYYDGIGYVTKDNEAMMIDAYIWNDDFQSSFKYASKLYVRVNGENCSDDLYEFNMSGSTAAFKFITGSY